MIFSNAIAALLLVSPLVNAQRFRLTQKGCLLDKADDVIAKIACGKRSTVTFAVEWHGADVQELESWLGVAGCSDQEALAEAQWAVARCQVPAKLEDSNIELRELAKNSGYLADKSSASPRRRALDVLDDRDLAERINLAGDNGDDDTDDDTNAKTDGTKDDNADDDSDPKTTVSTTLTTLSISTVTLAPTTISTSPNTWTLLKLTTINNKVVTLTSTCATTSSFNTTVCLTSHLSASCTTYPTETMACLAPYLCSFATDTGAFNCFERTPMHWTGWLVAAILAVAFAFSTSAIVFSCCRESSRRRRAAAAAAAIVALEPLRGKDGGAGSMKDSFGKGGGAGAVVVRELGVRASMGSVPPTPASVGDTMPLMEPEYPPEMGTPQFVGNHEQYSPYGQPPGIVVHREEESPFRD